MFEAEQEIKIAKITKIFGSNGELSLRLYDIFPESVDYNEPLFVKIDGLVVPLFIKSFIRKGASKAVAIFDDINNEYRAKEFIGYEIITFEQPEEDDEQDDELYYEMVAGYKFTDSVSGKSGKIIEFIDSEFNPLFRAEIDNTEVLIPVNDDMITLIDTKKKVIKMELPEGLFDLYL